MTAIVKLGCDPELFLKNKRGSFVSAAGLFPGTKKEPHPLEGGAVQVDGVALEFNILAAETEDQFENNIKKVLAQLDEMVKNVDKDLSMAFTPYAKFTEKNWKEIPEEAKVLGCDPDYNAMTGEVNQNPTEKLDSQPVRTAAGHVHIGWTEGVQPDDFQHFVDCRYVARGFHERYLEFYKPITQDEYHRIAFYGHNGSWRPKSYGVELRAPSNLWVASEETRRRMFQLTRKTFKSLTGM